MGSRVLLLLVLLSMSEGCYYDHEAILYPNASTCTPSDTPTFSGDIEPIFAYHCNSCHSGPYASAGIQLDDYTKVETYVHSGSLLGSITGATGYPLMPKDMSPLPDCEINNIKNWINNGAPNN